MTSYLAANAFLALTWIAMRLGLRMSASFVAPGRGAVRAARAVLIAAGVVTLGAVAAAAVSTSVPGERSWIEQSPPQRYWREATERVEGAALVARAGVEREWPAIRPLNLALARLAAGPMGGGWPGNGNLALAALIAVALARLAALLAKLAHATRDLPVTRRIGRVRVLASHGDVVPYSAWLPGRALVVLPANLWENAGDARVALRHELEHLRRRDPLWGIASVFIQLVFFWNPAARAWLAWLSENQEFACDEALLGRGAVSPQAYGHCLLRVAEMAVGSRPRPAGTTGLAAQPNGSLLKRRIKMMIEKRTLGSRAFAWAWGVVLGVLAVATVAAAAATFDNADRRLTIGEAQKLVAESAGAAESGASGGFPVRMNELVLRELNRDIGTPAARQAMKEAFSRLEGYRSLIEARASRYGVPTDVLAVPVVESRYKNITWSPGAGLWGFIRTTARTYDLVVDDGVDERLDVSKETTAAMELLGDLHDEFGDWLLALRGYNEGQNHVRKLIATYGTRDAWTLEHKAESREHYLARVTSVLILLQNPSLLD